MTTPTGDITLGDVAAELGVALPLTLGDSRVRALAGKPEGDITLGDLRGKSAYTPPSLSTSDLAEGYTFAPDGSLETASVDVTIDVDGGEEPFSWSWSRISGSSQISGSGARTFSASTTGMTPFTRSATFRGTLTDNRGATASIDLYVTLSAGQTLS